ncbi:hypothetical protein Snoj_01190 [Streptomyces nojiriensis]|uniref:Uncharacterized protein n=1 Tax=Streptomyces nojiriensis TaxID=66374 RepID=A0ABQ3SDJ5_9ACTN|nr:hypothetical protein JYK04_00096 [Streptomyces nojiriensis]GGS34337.1 hypothetical protein GCM10010205_75600 [Streptomyces nojiriensis]GHI66201.1 hypothetical protein Snoj_01190 [Streptomyces nojiriensis]
MTGVFVISGARAEQVTSAGPVTAYGRNDMVLDDWGTVTTWTATAPVPLVSQGPSGIGFVNFGDIDLPDVEAPIRTHGKGARGFDLYDGPLREARFAGIETTGDGSVGIQVSNAPRHAPRGRGRHPGGGGLSLVKGVRVVLKAIALSIKSGGQVDRVEIGGTLSTSGDNVVTLEIDGSEKRRARRRGPRARRVWPSSITTLAARHARPPQGPARPPRPIRSPRPGPGRPPARRPPYRLRRRRAARVDLPARFGRGPGAAGGGGAGRRVRRRQGVCGRWSPWRRRAIRRRGS